MKINFKMTEWQYAAEIHRTHPMVMELAPAFGFTPEQIDDLFDNPAGHSGTSP